MFLEIKHNSPVKLTHLPCHHCLLSSHKIQGGLPLITTPQGHCDNEGLEDFLFLISNNLHHISILLTLLLLTFFQLWLLSLSTSTHLKPTIVFLCIRPVNLQSSTFHTSCLFCSFLLTTFSDSMFVCLC